MRRLLLAFLLLGMSGQLALAEDPDEFYRPKKKEELNFRLDAAGENRADRERRQRELSSSQGCPEQVSIGGIVTDRPIFGNVDININLGDGVNINCSRF